MCPSNVVHHAESGEQDDRLPLALAGGVWQPYLAGVLLLGVLLLLLGLELQPLLTLLLTQPLRLGLILHQHKKGGVTFCEPPLQFPVSPLIMTDVWTKNDVQGPW